MINNEGGFGRGGLDEQKYWYKRAACGKARKSLFYSDHKEDTKIAKSICRECEVTVQCLMAALANDEYGVWGGTTEKDRKEMKKRLQRRSRPLFTGENNNNL